MHSTVLLDRKVKVNVTPMQLVARPLRSVGGKAEPARAYRARHYAILNRILGKKEWGHAGRAYLRRTLVAMYFDSLFTREYRSGKFVTERKASTMAQRSYDPRAVLESTFVALDRFGSAVYRSNLAAAGKKDGMDPRDAGFSTLWFILCTEKSKYVQKARITAGFGKPFRGETDS